MRENAFEPEKKKPGLNLNYKSAFEQLGPEQ